MKILNANELIDIVTKSFEAEKTGDTELGLELVSEDFKRRAMIVQEDKVFPVVSSQDIKSEVNNSFRVEGREFHVWNIAANEESQTVFVELVEIEPKDGRERVWPYALVCQIEDGKIKRSRHYGDPGTLDSSITVDDVREAVAD